MATVTLGTTAQTSLTSLPFKHGYNSGMSAADIATIALAIKDDAVGLHPIMGEAFSSNGQLYIPRRGFLKMLPGDYVGVDSQGWPILISANSIANGPWVHT